MGRSANSNKEDWWNKVSQKVIEKSAILIDISDITICIFFFYTSIHINKICFLFFYLHLLFPGAFLTLLKES